MTNLTKEQRASIALGIIPKGARMRLRATIDGKDKFTRYEYSGQHWSWCNRRWDWKEGSPIIIEAQEQLSRAWKRAWSVSWIVPDRHGIIEISTNFYHIS